MISMRHDATPRKGPVVYVVVADPWRRARIATDLQPQGWTVIEHPTGCHVLAELADILEGNTAECPAKIIIDKHAPGCTGTSIATGLAALGVNIPVELVDGATAPIWQPQPARCA